MEARRWSLFASAARLTVAAIAGAASAEAFAPLRSWRIAEVAVASVAVGAGISAKSSSDRGEGAAEERLRAEERAPSDAEAPLLLEETKQVVKYARGIWDSINDVGQGMDLRTSLQPLQAMLRYFSEPDSDAPELHRVPWLSWRSLLQHVDALASVLDVAAGAPDGGKEAEAARVAEEEACGWMIPFMTDLSNHLLAAPSEAREATLIVHEGLSRVLGLTRCCQTMVAAKYETVFLQLATASSDESWRLRDEWVHLWRCMEYSFWGEDHGRIRSGLRGWLWEVVMREMDYRLYGVYESLTVQFVQMPLCVHRTLVREDRTRTQQDAFFEPYADCVPTHMSYAVDHLILAGHSRRALDVYDLARSMRHRGRELVQWSSVYNTAVMFLPYIASCPWWQLHPEITGYVDFLERHYETIASERANMEAFSQYQEDAFPATSRGLAWRAVDFYMDGRLGDDVCAVAPRTCELLGTLSWANSGEVGQMPVRRKMAWNVVAPGKRLGGHSGQTLRINVQLCVFGCEGAELHLNGDVIPYVAGKVFAWQDGWRHEVINRGSRPRWVFMITLPHPEFQQAWDAFGGDWAQTYARLRTPRESPQRCPTSSPWARGRSRLTS
eukprot:TRINITY_DN15739_c0_g1_i1.p1 TRINITY_DN15739_c0_g1~~TRINITY_DN15739_c0_g1_i1.p1  ORF type:complete len:611 (-),score=119.89 TRINITY_DN15739_c0_g1_i1:1536-3368(-)